MRKSQSLHLSAILVFFFSALTSAWPWPRFLPEIDSLVVRQQDNNPDSATSQASATNTGSVAPKATGSSATNKVTTSPSTQSGSTAGGKGSSSTSNKPTTAQPTSYDPRIPAGGVSMLTPAPISGAQYYKIGDHVTFAWNYTSLLGTPASINVVATCSANNQLYTLAANQTITNGTQAVVWDTNAYQSENPTVQLVMETYTLIIYDAAGSISAPARAGYLAPYNQFTFGMYKPQPYQDLNDGFQCATCSGALSEMERRALGFMLGMSALTVLSFTWFVRGIDVDW